MTADADADAEAIKALRERDAAAARAGDFATLRAIISDDAVVLAPGSEPKVGKAAIDASFAQMANALRTHEVVDYRFELSEPEIAGDLAIEYGAIVGSMRALVDGNVAHYRYNVLRILRRESDGRWRVYRTIWNAA
jgi:uncharacterized protein (TIGR02246 family)